MLYFKGIKSSFFIVFVCVCMCVYILWVLCVDFSVWKHNCTYECLWFVGKQKRVAIAVADSIE